MKIFKNRKGMTLIEVIVSMTVLGILSAPVLMIFTNSMMTVKLANDRIEINAATRIIKESVTNSVKYGGGNTLTSFDTDGTGTEYVLELKTYPPIHSSNFKIIDGKNKPNGKYKFDVSRTKTFGEIVDYPNTCEYLITIKKIADDSTVQKLTFLINSLTDELLTY